MDVTATRASPTSLPNLLTYGRIAAVPAMVAAFLLLEGDDRRWIAFAIFVVASVTDWLDGYLARIWKQQSALGRMLDPIADKLLVGAALLLLVHDGTISTTSIWAALIILSREILVSGLREFLAELNVRVHVSRLAKWKTTMQMMPAAPSAMSTIQLVMMKTTPMVQPMAQPIPVLTRSGTVSTLVLWVQATELKTTKMRPKTRKNLQVT